jgi:hypothetical protein
MEKRGHRSKHTWREAIDLLREMEDMSIEMTERAYTMSIRALTYKTNQWRTALELLDEMKELHALRPTVEAYEWVMDGCIQALAWQQALAAFAEMRVRHKPEKYTALLALQACEIGCQWQMAVRMLEWMDGRKMDITPMHYQSALNAAERAGEYEWADMIEAEAEENGIFIEQIDSLVDRINDKRRGGGRSRSGSVKRGEMFQKRYGMTVRIHG